uniref:CoA carboxyltransferase C-terminal domain-containing protein n=1 Tax=Gongylonema pulchrum TaxID=637853 RepID=A0A183EIJ8_9BILA
LPLFIFANWRGFSGGQKDMFEMVLKFGAYIVDQLCKFLNPVIVYIPPHGELRGGAWAVIDPTINPVCMQMFADPRSRGGVLEPEGTVQVKMRKDLVPLMRRLDKEMMRLAVLEKEGQNVKVDTDARIELLMPTYRNIAITFADLHDTPVRMKAVGAIKAGNVKCVDDIRRMKDLLQCYFKETRSDEAFSWESVPDSDALAVLDAERKQIVTFLVENDFSKTMGERYGIPAEKLARFIREMRNNECDQ